MSNAVAGEELSEGLPASQARSHAGVLLPVLWVAVLGFAAALRFYHIGASSLWSDEGNTWAIVQRSFAQIARDAAADIHPPLYYVLVRAWSLLFGTSVTALRSFSALCGIGVVAVVGAIAAHVTGAGPGRRWLPLLAALWGAANPFQVYYSQEARMYMLLALEAALLLWLLLSILDAEGDGAHEGSGRRHWGLWAGYVVVAVAGLWTHYSFPVVMAAAGAAYLVDWLLRRRRQQQRGSARWSDLWRFVALNLLALLFFAPWLPTAWHQVTTWPQGGDAIGLGEGVTLTLRALLFGPIRSAPEPAWGWVLLAGVLPLAGIFALRRSRGIWAVTLAFAAPIVLMFALGLYSEAFLKFLLVASAPWCLLIAASAEVAPEARAAPWLRRALAALAVALAAVTLPGYYADAAARDNYQGIAAYVAAVADPVRDLVLLDAPGQRDVWAAYDPGLEVLALPAQRPADPTATTAALENATAGKRALYALFWATDEADPEQIVEGWLNAHLFRGMESWQGNVRFVEYRVADALTCAPVAADFGPAVRLEEACQPERPQSVEAGQPAVVELEWSADAPLAENLKVSVQLQDARGQVVAQHDGEPGGGARPTNTWRAGERIADRHAILIPVGTPPGEYRLSAVLYDPASGARLETAEGDRVDLGALAVSRPTRTLPTAILPMQTRVGRPLGPVTLLGYDLFKQGYAHAPETPVEAGETLHVTLFWQAPEPLPGDWPEDETFTLTLGTQSVTAPLAGGGYPTAEWQPGEIVRGEFDIAYDGTRQGWLAVADRKISLDPLPR